MSFIYPPKIIAIVEHFLLIFVTKTKKTSKIAKLAFFDPLYIFHLFRSEKVNFWKSHFSAKWETWKFSDLKRSIAKSPRNLREISSRFRACGKSKKKKKGKLFYLSKAIFWKTSLNFDRVYLRSSSWSELQILHVYVTYPHRHFHKIFFRSEKIFFCFCPRIRPCLSACFLRSTWILTFQILHVYVIYLPTPSPKIIFRSEKIFFCFCPKLTFHFNPFLLASFPLLSFHILHVYVIYLPTPLPKIIFRSEKKSFSFYFKNESHFNPFLLIYF